LNSENCVLGAWMISNNAFLGTAKAGLFGDNAFQ
jgi:hypothetical protein